MSVTELILLLLSLSGVALIAACFIFITGSTDKDELYVSTMCALNVLSGLKLRR